MTNLKKIHVNQHKIRANLKGLSKEPVLTIKHANKISYANNVKILDEAGRVIAQVIYSDKPLSCGARVWIETNLTLEIDGVILND